MLIFAGADLASPSSQLLAPICNRCLYSARLQSVPDYNRAEARITNPRQQRENPEFISQASIGKNVIIPESMLIFLNLPDKNPVEIFISKRTK